MSVEIMLIGLGEVGASIGLALGGSGLEVERLGFDPDKSLARRAHKAGAVDRLVATPYRAAQNVELVIVNLVNSEAQEYIASIAPRLKPGGVVFDGAPVKQIATQWAAEAIPEKCHYVAITPIIGPGKLSGALASEGEPRADLFAGGVLAIVALPSTHQKAIDTAIHLGDIMGAKPFFVEPSEHDAIMSAAEDLPTLMSLATLHVASQAPSWREIQRMAGRAFTAGTALCEIDTPEILGNAIHLRGGHIIARIDATIEALEELRSLIAQGDQRDLEAKLRDLDETRRKWLVARRESDWRESPIKMSQMPRRSVLGRMFGIGPDRPRGRPKQ